MPELQYLYGVANLRAGRLSLALWPLRKARENGEWAVRAGEALAAATLARRGPGRLDRGRDARAGGGARPPRHAEAPRRGAASREPLRGGAARRRTHRGARPRRRRCAGDAAAMSDRRRPARRRRGVVRRARHALERAGAARGRRRALLRRARDLREGEATTSKLAEKRFEECLEDVPDQPVVVHAALAILR